MILVFGKTGQVGMELAALENIHCLDRNRADLTDPESCINAIHEHKPEAVINAAAYTAVDQAEEEESIAYVVNCTTPTAMAKACASNDIPFVQISTDYVFDGSGVDPWVPGQEPKPINAYGRTKLAGEKGIRTSGAQAIILRTSWIFSAHGDNFVKTMLRLSQTHSAISIVADQVGGPTSARSIARACQYVAKQMILDTSKQGIHHLSGTPDVSWADFATEIFNQAKRSVYITKLSTSEYPKSAKRPLNSRLDCTSLEDVFGVSRPSWRRDLREVLADLETNSLLPQDG